jgi:hypothetical protein
MAVWFLRVYGLAFQQANHKDLGGGDLQDEVYASRVLAETGYLKRETDRDHSTPIMVVDERFTSAQSPTYG